ncbi:MAG TPA: hypothetical protein PLA43_02005 [Bryobacteraceae bacterium]|nr:hypothetical protein [Bryobacteraceae bacterium]HOQ44383.1 hypothetical protein [Bryobacteraceae bacterium]HPQ14605.1 hypothetical protein [Bryobacteraceae bacterium]HPU70702.1 hypothetical protein [Bryobacteraceae bacterium]
MVRKTVLAGPTPHNARASGVAFGFTGSQGAGGGESSAACPAAGMTQTAR